MATGILNLVLCDGERKFLVEGTAVTIRLTDGNLNQTTIKVTKPTTRINVEFTDGPRNRYIVSASAAGYEIAGFFPLVLSETAVQTVYLMLIPHDGHFNFADARWDAIPVDLKIFLSSGATDDAAAQKRYGTMMDVNPENIACLLNIVTAMRAMAFNPFSYFKQLIWNGDLGPAQDRFFAYVDRKLLGEVAKQVPTTFEQESAADLLLHPGSTSSYKETDMLYANVQFTFHEHAAPPPSMPEGEDWVLVEPDIDLYQGDDQAHAIDEVIPGFLSSIAPGVKTNPRDVYVLRWIATKQAGLPEFAPPFTIVS